MSSISSDSLSELYDEFNDHDVLCGRGGAINSHIGNYTFRHLINLNKSKYFFSTKEKKAEIALNLVNAIRSLPGRFLKQDIISGLWYDIGNDKAIEKTRQALRENTSKRRRSSNDTDSDISTDQIKVIESLFATSKDSHKFVPYFPKISQGSQLIAREKAKESNQRNTRKSNFIRKDQETKISRSSKYRLSQNELTISKSSYQDNDYNFCFENHVCGTISRNNCHVLHDTISHILPQFQVASEYFVAKKEEAFDEDDYLAHEIVEASFQLDKRETIKDEEIDRLIYETFAKDDFDGTFQQFHEHNNSVSMNDIECRKYDLSFHDLQNSQGLEGFSTPCCEPARKKLRADQELLAYVNSF